MSHGEPLDPERRKAYTAIIGASRDAVRRSPRKDDHTSRSDIPDALPAPPWFIHHNRRSASGGDDHHRAPPEVAPQKETPFPQAIVEPSSFENRIGSVAQSTRKSYENEMDALRSQIHHLELQLRDKDVELHDAESENRMLKHQLRQERSLKDTAIASARYSGLEEAAALVQRDGIRALERRLAAERLSQTHDFSVSEALPQNTSGYGRSQPRILSSPSLQHNRVLKDEFHRRMKEAFEQSMLSL